MKHVLAIAKVYTLVAVVVVLAIELAPGPFFGPQPAWYERLSAPGAGLALLVVGWAWLLRIRKGVEKP